MKASVSDANPLETGVWVARIRSIIDLGIQQSPMYGKQHQIWVSFETEQLDEHNRGKLIGSFFNLSLNDKSNLSKLILGVFGKYVPQDKKATFDFRCLLDQPVQLTIVPDQRKDGSTKLKISSYGYIKAGRDQVAPLTRETEFFDLDDPDWDLYETFNEWIKERISFEKTEDEKEEPKNQEKMDEFEDDIPF